jgi:hypothetical protein
MKSAYKKQRVVRDGRLFVVVVRSDVIGLVMEIYLRAVVYGIVRVRWVDHKCKVNSDEFDEEATLCSW